MNTMADGASERLDAQIADALFGQPGMSKMDVANRLRQLRGDGGALLGSAAYPAAWMWPHPEDGSVRFTADGDVATEAASMGRAVSALYRVPVQENAQPSPAVQGDAADSRVRFDAWLKSIAVDTTRWGNGAYTDPSADAYWRAWRAALSARQPVGAVVKDSLTVGGGQAVAWMTHHDEPMLYPTFSEAAAYCDDDEPPIPLYAAPPAHAVDLERFRPAVMTALGLSSPYGLEREALNELLDLIDSKRDYGEANPPTEWDLVNLNAASRGTANSQEAD